MMDRLFKAYGTEGYRERDLSIRYVEEKDIPAIAELFRLNYGDAYPSPDVYDGTWVKRSLHSDHIICLVLQANEKVLATGSVVLNYGDYNDKSGELARLAVHPDYSGLGIGRRVITSLLKVGKNTVEFAIGEARTAHSFSQARMEEAEFSTIGFVPQYFNLKNKRESVVLYGKLHGAGSFLRSSTPPSVIQEILPLAGSVLGAMELSVELSSISDDQVPLASHSYATRPLERAAMGPLLRIPQGRVVDPLLFGTISIEQGFTFVRDKAQYVVAYDEEHPVGTIGYQFDETNKLVKGIELIAKTADVWRYLCKALIQASEARGAEVIEVNVSAYQPKLQRLLHNLGFRAVAYAPAMVFHLTERLDVIKMVKLNVPYDPGDMCLTQAAQKMVSLIEKNFR